MATSNASRARPEATAIWTRNWRWAPPTIGPAVAMPVITSMGRRWTSRMRVERALMGYCQGNWLASWEGGYAILGA